MRVRELLVPVLLAIVIAAASISIGLSWRRNAEEQRQSDEERLIVACAIEDSSIEELEAIAVVVEAVENLQERLGVPVDSIEVQVPQKSEECK